MIKWYQAKLVTHFSTDIVWRYCVGAGRIIYAQDSTQPGTEWRYHRQTLERDGYTIMELPPEPEE